MVLARVIGTVVATRKDDRLNGSKLQIVQPVSLGHMSPDGKPLVAIDPGGPGQGHQPPWFG